MVLWLSENRLKMGVVQGVGQYSPNFHVEGNVPHQSFSHGWLGQWMRYTPVADSF